MANYLATDTDLTAVANAIRTKGGTSGQLSFPSGFVSAISSIPTGGSTVTESDVNFIDYDGTLVASKTKAEINAMSSDSDLPANPSHTGLVAQGWNWTVAQLKAQLTAMPNQKITVGQMYNTASGATEIDIELTGIRLSPFLSICVNGTVTVDWGDNTTPDTQTGTSMTKVKYVGHNYASTGKYTITITKTSGSNYSFNLSSSTSIITSENRGNTGRAYATIVRSIRIGSEIANDGIANYTFNYLYLLESVTLPSNITNIGAGSFTRCYSLRSVVIPKEVTTLGNQTFQYAESLENVSLPGGLTTLGNEAFSSCYALKDITIPNGVTSIAANTFYTCFGLKNVSIPSGLTTLGSNAFNSCHTLKDITIPNGVTSIGDDAFNTCLSLANIVLPANLNSIGIKAIYYCMSLSSVIIPSGVTSIGKNAFASCYNMKEYHFQSATPPALQDATVFTSIASDCVIYVPQGKLNDYQTASNWSEYASYIQEEPS